MAKNTYSKHRKKFHTAHELTYAAYHEAGHIVYGLFYLVKVDSARIFTNKSTKSVEGVTYFWNYPKLGQIKDQDLLNQRLYAEIGVNYSGLMAEKKQFQLLSGSEKFPMLLKNGSYGDLQDASKLCQKHKVHDPGKQRGQFKKKVMKEVSEDLHTHWEAVILVAHQLFKYKKINYEGLRRLLTKKTQAKEVWKEKFKTIDTIYQEGVLWDEENLKILFSV